MNIIILNLSREITANELTEIFKEFGTVKSCDLVKDKISGASKGFGFVKMSNESEANAAIEGLHGKNINGQRIRVKISTKE